MIHLAMRYGPASRCPTGEPVVRACGSQSETLIPEDARGRHRTETLRNPIPRALTCGRATPGTRRLGIGTDERARERDLEHKRGERGGQDGKGVCLTRLVRAPGVAGDALGELVDRHRRHRGRRGQRRDGGRDESVDAPLPPRCSAGEERWSGGERQKEMLLHLHYTTVRLYTTGRRYR